MECKSDLLLSRLSMSEVTTYRWSLAEDAHHYLSAGYEAIGVWRQKLADYGEEAGIDLLAGSGLRVSNLFWTGGFTGSDGRTLTEAIDDACHAIRLAGAMNAGCLIVYPGGRNNHIYRHAERLFRLALDSLLAMAEDADVTLAVEPMHPACCAQWTFLSDLESAISLIDSIGSPHLRLVFDTYHFGHDRTLLANAREIVPYLALVQLGDRSVPHGIEQERCHLGTGVLPLKQIVEEFVNAGYQGDFDIELLGQDFESRTYRQILDDCRESLETMNAPLSAS